ncbi:MAG TPA: IS200/IS605 family transposase [Gammaproteobacteria bacterium]|jgi:REP element-mobilizing transposase RayT|nr:IS200/IS605 family transposase [Gammaproteobacteria bacterium]
MSKSLSQIYIHIVFSTKNRKPYLSDHSARDRLYQYIVKICDNHKSHVLAIGGTSDHIHLLLSLNKSTSVSKIIEEIKSSTSKWIKSINGEDFYWQNGYGAFSVSQSNVDAVIKYIHNQESHHKKYSFKEELIKLLKAHKVSYDEKYLWT